MSEEIDPKVMEAAGRVLNKTMTEFMQLVEENARLKADLAKDEQAPSKQEIK